MPERRAPMPVVVRRERRDTSGLARPRDRRSGYGQEVAGVVGSLAWRVNWKATDTCLSESTDYCWALTVLSRYGCPNGVYGETNVVVNGTVTEYANDLLGSLGQMQKGILVFRGMTVFPGSTGEVVYELTKLNCR